MRTRILAAAFAALAIVSVGASTAQAGGSGDFYKTASCRPWNMKSGSLVVTNYDAPDGAQRYHIDMDPGLTTSGFNATAYRSYFDGVNQNRTNDYYVWNSVRSSVHTIEAKWQAGLSYTSCSVTL